MVRLRAPSCATLMFFVTSTAAFSFPHQLLQRASGCSNPADIPCNQGLPSDFCCESTTVCLALAGNTTALCCPKGQSCHQIQVVSCDIQLQNATAHPENALKTTELTGALPLCGSQCCPFGYACSGNTTCIEESNQNLAPGQTIASSSTSPLGSTTSIVSPSAISSVHSAAAAAAATQATPTAAEATTSTITTPVAKKDSAFPAGAVLAGFFPGIVAGVLISIACFCLLRSRRRKQAKRFSGASSFTNHPPSTGVSDPIFDSASAVRTDFLRKQSQMLSSNDSSPPRLGQSPTLKRVAGFVRKSMHMNSNNSGTYTNTDPMNAVPRPAPLPPMTSAPPRTAIPKTPRAQRENSGVSINVFAASDISTPPMNVTAPLNISRQPMRRGSHQTTISDFIENNHAERADLAGLKKGEPFIQQPAYGNYTHERKGSSGRNTTPRRREGS